MAQKSDVGVASRQILQMPFIIAGPGNPELSLPISLKDWNKCLETLQLLQAPHEKEVGLFRPVAADVPGVQGRKCRPWNKVRYRNDRNTKSHPLMDLFTRMARRDENIHVLFLLF